MSELDTLLSKAEGKARRYIDRERWNSLVKLGVKHNNRLWVIDGLEHGCDSWNLMIQHACLQGDCELLDKVFSRHSIANHKASTLYGAINWEEAVRKTSVNGGREISQALERHIEASHQY